MINRGESDSKNTYPELDSNIKAAHTKPILFFLLDIAKEISENFCNCTSLRTVKEFGLFSFKTTVQGLQTFFFE